MKSKEETIGGCYYLSLVHDKQYYNSVNRNWVNSIEKATQFTTATDAAICASTHHFGSSFEIVQARYTLEKV